LPPSRELADQVLVGRAEQVGKLEARLRRRTIVEVVDELAELLVRDGRLADLALKSMCPGRPSRACFSSSSAASAAFSPVAYVVVQLNREVLPRAASGTKNEPFVVVPASRARFSASALLLPWRAVPR
jgi:hypothetical protein